MSQRVNHIFHILLYFISWMSILFLLRQFPEMHHYIIAQICGFCGMIAILSGYMQKDDSTVAKFLYLSNFFWGLHFVMLGVFTGFAAVLLSISRLFLSTRYKKSKKIFFGLLSANFAIGVFTYDGFISLFPLISSALGSYGFFFLERIKLRVLMMMTSLMWLVYNSVIGSISGIINETMVQLVLLFTIYRMMHIDGGMKYYSQKIADILWKRSRPDYDRYIFIRDNLAGIRHKIGTHFLKILHYDLRKFFHRKKSQSFIESLQDKVLE